jgi:hypothetical protein
VQWRAPEPAKLLLLAQQLNFFLVADLRLRGAQN